MRWESHRALHRRSFPELTVVRLCSDRVLNRIADHVVSAATLRVMNQVLSEPGADLVVPSQLLESKAEYSHT